MKTTRKWISLILILTVLFTSIPILVTPGVAQAASNDDSSDTAIKAVIGVAVATTIYFITRHFQKQGKMEKYYNLGDKYARQGAWAKAADAYAKCAKISSDYKNVKQKLTHAKKKATEMYIKKGDQAKAQEQYEEAVSFYQKGLKYSPTSLEVKNKLDKLKQRLVEVHYRRGHTFEVQNEWQQAFNEYKKAYNYNPDYKDLANRYYRAKAKINGNLPLLGVLFFINHTNQPGLEKPLINALQTQLEGTVSDEFYLIAHQKVQKVMNEQAGALSDTMDKGLAVDLGRILGANQTLIGDITSVSVDDDRVQMKATVKIVNVKTGKIDRKIKHSYRFSEDVSLNNLSEAMPKFAKGLAKKIAE